MKKAGKSFSSVEKQEVFSKEASDQKIVRIGNINTNYLNLLKDFISMKSISTDPRFKSDCEQTATWLEQLFLSSGFDVKIDHAPHTNPLVMAKYIVSPEKETVLIYGHYDVQPAEQADGWDHDPFELTEREGRLSARGAIDNKGQVLVHIHTVLTLIREDKLAYNVIFMIEGNEESGNKDIAEQLKKYSDFLKSDYVLISDGEIVKNRPTVEASFRGGSNITVKITTAPNNFHSGIYGGAVPSSSMVLSQVLASLKDTDNQILVPGFYDGVHEISNEQKQANTSLATEQEILELSGVKKILTEPGIDFYSQTGLRPTLEISGIHSGYTGVGYLNIVPSHAEARINIRTAPGQQTQLIIDTVKDFLVSQTPDYADIDIEQERPADPILLNVHSKKSQEIQAMLESVYGEPVAIKYVGGSIPIVANFVNDMGMDVISVSLANEDCNMHGVHENFNIEMLEKALAFSYQFFSQN